MIKKILNKIIITTLVASTLLSFTTISSMAKDNKNLNLIYNKSYNTSTDIKDFLRDNNITKLDNNKIKKITVEDYSKNNYKLLGQIITPSKPCCTIYDFRDVTDKGDYFNIKHPIISKDVKVNELLNINKTLKVKTKSSIKIEPNIIGNSLGYVMNKKYKYSKSLNLKKNTSVLVYGLYKNQSYNIFKNNHLVGKGNIYEPQGIRVITLNLK